MLTLAIVQRPITVHSEPPQRVPQRGGRPRRLAQRAIRTTPSFRSPFTHSPAAQTPTPHLRQPAQIREPRTALLIALADAGGLLAIPFDKRELRGRKKRIKEISEGSVVAGAARDAIQAAHAACIAATTAATVAATTAATAG